MFFFASAFPARPAGCVLKPWSHPQETPVAPQCSMQTFLSSPSIRCCSGSGGVMMMMITHLLPLTVRPQCPSLLLQHCHQRLHSIKPSLTAGRAQHSPSCIAAASGPQHCFSVVTLGGLLSYTKPSWWFSVPRSYSQGQVADSGLQPTFGWRLDQLSSRQRRRAAVRRHPTRIHTRRHGQSYKRTDMHTVVVVSSTPFSLHSSAYLLTVPS